MNSIRKGKDYDYYAETHLDLDPEDEIYFENVLLHFFDKQAPYEGKIDKERILSHSVPDSFIEEIV